VIQVIFSNVARALDSAATAMSCRAGYVFAPGRGWYRMTAAGTRHGAVSKEPRQKPVSKNAYLAADRMPRSSRSPGTNESADSDPNQGTDKGSHNRENRYCGLECDRAHEGKLRLDASPGKGVGRRVKYKTAIVGLPD
jgi:hypothetical protein